MSSETCIPQGHSRGTPRSQWYLNPYVDHYFVFGNSFIIEFFLYKMQSSDRFPCKRMVFSWAKRKGIDHRKNLHSQVGTENNFHGYWSHSTSVVIIMSLTPVIMRSYLGNNNDTVLDRCRTSTESVKNRLVLQHFLYHNFRDLLTRSNL